MMNTTRIDELIAKRGARPNLSLDDWQQFIDLVLARLGSSVCYGFCLYPYSHIPAKGYFVGFPGRVSDRLQYLNLLDLWVRDEEARGLLIAFLDERGCPWEITTRYDCDTDAEEPAGIRILGYGAPDDDAGPASAGNP